MMNTILQFCDPSKGFGDYLKDFNFWDAIACQYADPVGFYVFGLLVYTGVALPIYIRTNSMTIPAVLLLIVGGVVTPQVAGVATPFTTLIVAGSLAGSLAMLYYSYGR
jgi:hypothetical protein